MTAKEYIDFYFQTGYLPPKYIINMETKKPGCLYEILKITIVYVSVPQPCYTSYHLQHDGTYKNVDGIYLSLGQLLKKGSSMPVIEEVRRTRDGKIFTKGMSIRDTHIKEFMFDGADLRIVCTNFDTVLMDAYEDEDPALVEWGILTKIINDSYERKPYTTTKIISLKKLQSNIDEYLRRTNVIK